MSEPLPGGININSVNRGCMQVRFSYPIFFFIALLILPQFSQSQTTKQKKEQLQQQMKKLQEEIKLMETAMAKTSAKKEKDMGEVLALQQKIETREKLIGNMNNQINGLNETISETESEIDSKSKEVEKMKIDYADMLRKSYHNLTLQNELAFFLASNSFYDAIRRYSYLLKIAEYRRNQAKDLEDLIADLEQKKNDLQANKVHKVNLLQQQSAQKTKLESEKAEKDEAVAVLQEKEKKLRKQIAEKNKAAAQLNGRIQNIIEDEIKAAKRKAEEDAKKKKTVATKSVSVSKSSAETMPLTPAEQIMSNDFSNNKGRLPWPVDKGEITAQFGKHEHPIIKGVMIENNGVDIKTVPGADAKAVFGGTVVSVFFLATTQNCIIVKHGEYFTVYSNIETVTVKTGQTITTKQSLGKLHLDKSEDVTKVHLEIWKGKDKMDPEQWLAHK